MRNDKIKPNWLLVLQDKIREREANAGNITLTRKKKGGEGGRQVSFAVARGGQSQQQAEEDGQQPILRRKQPQHKQNHPIQETANMDRQVPRCIPVYVCIFS